MKLYATVQSERAMKAQGGKYLEIDIFNNRRVPYAKLFVHEDLSLELTNSSGTMKYQTDAVSFTEKGEKKKSETVCQHTPKCEEQEEGKCKAY